MDEDEKKRLLQQEEEYLRRHNHPKKKIEDHLEFEQKVRAPPGRYRLVTLNREDSIPFSVESVVGDFDSVEDAEKEAYRMELTKTTQFAIFNTVSLEKSFERVKWVK